MPLIALGLNHKTAPVSIRETVAVDPARLQQALKSLQQLPDVKAAAILSTCNRTEIYCEVDQLKPEALTPEALTQAANEALPDVTVTHQVLTDQVLDWFLTEQNIQDEKVRDHFYHYVDEATVRHLFQVACGLDSMVLGEPQILGQLKTAFSLAADAGAMGSVLHQLFQSAFSVAKQVRTETQIGANPVSIAYSAVQLAKQIFTDLGEQTVMLIGAGETIDLVGQHLKSQGVHQFMLANRTLSRGQKLADKFASDQVDVQTMTLPEIANHLAQADIVITSTASPLPIIGRGLVQRALKQRRYQPMLIVDLAVPRDVEPEAAELNDAYLYTVDDLQQIVQENQQSREQAAAEARLLIEQKVQAFLQWQASLKAQESIRRYREQAQAIQQASLQKARQLLQQGRDTDEVLEFLARTLTNKLIHKPTERLRSLAQDPDYLKQINELLQE